MDPNQATRPSGFSGSSAKLCITANAVKAESFGFIGVLRGVHEGELKLARWEDTSLSAFLE
jgi:hypothetical protein